MVAAARTTPGDDPRPRGGDSAPKPFRRSAQQRPYHRRRAPAPPSPSRPARIPLRARHSRWPPPWRGSRAACRRSVDGSRRVGAQSRAQQIGIRRLPVPERQQDSGPSRCNRPAAGRDRRNRSGSGATDRLGDDLDVAARRANPQEHRFPPDRRASRSISGRATAARCASGPPIQPADWRSDSFSA